MRSEQTTAEKVLRKVFLSGGTIGVQTLNEFVKVVAGKLKAPGPDVIRWLAVIQKLCPPPMPVTLNRHRLEELKAGPVE